jgi:hypothetical protein
MKPSLVYRANANLNRDLIVLSPRDGNALIPVERVGEVPSMVWATEYIAKLQRGETVEFRPRGQSMRGKIESGQLCTVVPVTEELHVGDIVLCKVNGRQYLHLIKAIQGERFQIGNNRGHINGWVSRHSIYGKCIAVR